MAINFPSSPSNNQLFVAEGKAMRYNASKGKWRQVSTLTSSQITDLESRTVGVSSMSISGNTLVIQKDDSSYANVSLASFAGNKLTTYANASILPLSDLVSGTQVYVEDTDSLYITDGSGWYKIATVNLSPSLTLGVESISLSSGGSVDVNYTVNEPEDTPYTITASSTSNVTITVYQANNTITFNSPVQATTETITISATDGVNSVGDTLTMTITTNYNWSNTSNLTESRMVSSGTGVGDQLGVVVDISSDGTTAIAGAPYNDTNNTNSGKAAIFTYNGSSWSEQTILYINDSNVNNYFGYSVALSDDGDTAVVGAIGTKDPTYDTPGAIFVYTRSGSTWSLQQKILSSTPTNDYRFGTAVSISGDGLTIAASQGRQLSTGHVWVYTLVAGTWSLQQRIQENLSSAAYFGRSLSLSEDGNYLAIGSPSKDFAFGGTYNNNGNAVYIFTRSGSTWSKQATITPSSLATNAIFGQSVGLSKTNADTLVVGHRFEFSGLTYAWVYTRSGSTWGNEVQLIGSDTINQDYFGHAVAISDAGDHIVVGAHNDKAENNNYSGTAFVFYLDSGSWSQTKIAPTISPGQNDLYGKAVAFSGDSKVTFIGSSADGGGGSCYSWEAPVA